MRLGPIRPRPYRARASHSFQFFANSSTPSKWGGGPARGMVVSQGVLGRRWLIWSVACSSKQRRPACAIPGPKGKRPRRPKGRSWTEENCYVPPPRVSLEADRPADMELASETLCSFALHGFSKPGKQVFERLTVGRADSADVRLLRTGSAAAARNACRLDARPRRIFLHCHDPPPNYKAQLVKHTREGLGNLSSFLPKPIINHRCLSPAA